VGLFDPKCEACDKRTPKKSLKEGFCPDCYDTLEAYWDIRDILKKRTGKILELNPRDVVKMSEEELRKALADLTHVDKPKTVHGFTDKYDPNITLEALRDDFGIKRVRYDYISSLHDTPCEECQKLNGAKLTIAEAIEFNASRITAHANCGRWLPLRERDPNAEPYDWE